MTTRRRLYNPAQLTPEELAAAFVARRRTLADMLRQLRRQAPDRPLQHLMLIGARGMGKTTLGLRFLHEVAATPSLAAQWQPVPFHEESYGVADLADFWLAALDHLARATGESRWADRAADLARNEKDAERRAAYARAALLDFRHESGKRPILFVENLDAVIAQMRGERAAHGLRASLMTCPDILLIGSANTVFHAIRDHAAALYEFFRPIVLEGLDENETLRLFQAVAKREERPEIPDLAGRDRGRIETIRRLTGGNPRLLALACRLSIESPLGPAFEDLERLIDEQTPYFKARIEELPVQARKVFHCLADEWAPLPARAVAAAANLSSSQASAQLRQLVDRGYAREARLPSEKRSHYEVADRFYNIYFLLRFSRTQRERLKGLVAFLHDLFGPGGVRTMYPRALENFRSRSSSYDEASDLIAVLAEYVAEDDEFVDSDAWWDSATDLIRERIGADAPIIEEIDEIFLRPNDPADRRVEELMQRARMSIQSRDFAGAEKALIEVTDMRPDHIWAWMEMATMRKMQERRSDAEAAFACVRKIIASYEEEEWHDFPDNVDIILALFIMTIGYSSWKRYDDVVSIYDQFLTHVNVEDIISRTPAEMRYHIAQIYRFGGNALSELERKYDAIAAYQNVPELIHRDDPADWRKIAASACQSMGRVFREMEKDDEAIVAWKRVASYVRKDDPIKMRAELIASLLCQGYALMTKKQNQRAVSELRKVTYYMNSEDPQKERTPVALGLSAAGIVLTASGYHADGEELFRTAVKLDPTSELSWCYWADFILKQGDSSRLGEAERYALRALELSTGDPESSYILFKILSIRGSWGKALDRLEHCVREGGEEFWNRHRSDLIDDFIRTAAAGHAQQVKQTMAEASLTETMEPLWHAIRAELGEEVEALPAEIADAAADVRGRIAAARG